ncbi:MAG: sugar-binding transcriptional regulator [Granulosicoccus sp.]
MTKLDNAEPFVNVAGHDVWPEQLAVRVARCYYDLGMTQQQIAQSLRISRARVIRLLAECRDKGVVTIRINSPLLENLELADSLVQRYQLRAADVCLSNASDELQLAQQVGRAAGEVVLRHILDDTTIGLGWGVTLKEMVAQLTYSPRKNVSVVSLLGSLTRRSTIARFEATTQLASRLDAECLYLPAPIVCDSASTRQLLEEQPLFKDIHRRALKADVAIVSIGGMDSATIRQVGLVNSREYSSVRKAGAIGNFLGFYIDDDGELVQHPINERIIGIPGVVFKRLPRRLMISAGKNKVSALKAVLSQGYVSDLVTDQTTARALLV